MLNDSYLNSESVKNNCREYICYLEDEMYYYGEVLEALDDFVNNIYMKGKTNDELCSLAKDVSVGVEKLIYANEIDIEEAKNVIKSIDDVGVEVYIGDVILDGKNNALNDMKRYGDKASECFRKAYEATDNKMIEYWSRQGRNYDDLVRSAREIYNFYSKKEERYDEINNRTRNLFLNSAIERVRALGLLGTFEEKVIFNTDAFAKSANYSQIEDDIKKLLGGNNMSVEEINELITLQHADKDSLSPEEVVRMEALEAMLLVAAPVAWKLYDLNVGDRNDTIDNFYDELMTAGFKEKTEQKDDLSVEYESKITNTDDEAEVTVDKDKVISKEVLYINEGEDDPVAKAMPYFDETNPSGIATEKKMSDLLFRSYENDVTFENTTVTNNISKENLNLNF